MQQALQRTNIQLSEGSRISPGSPGQATLHALVPGERVPLQLAPRRNPAGQSSEDDLATARTGPWCAAQVFVLPQALA